MAKLVWVGSPHNFETVTAVRVIETGGDLFDITDSISGDIEIVPAKGANVPAKNRGETVAVIKGETSDGSLTIPLHARAWTDVEVAGNPTLYECLAQTNTGTRFEPYQSVPMSGFDGDSGPDYMLSPNAKCFKFEIELQPARSGTPTAIKGQLLTVYAEVMTPDIKIANVGGVSSISITGPIRRRGQIALSTV